MSGFTLLESGSVLGKGGYGKVITARDNTTGEVVAAKLVPTRRMKQHAIEKEVELLRRLVHPNIIGLRGAEKSESQYIIYMELAAGGELFTRVIQDGNLPEDVARRYFAQLMGAVEFMHRHGVAHRDLKLENVLLDGSDACKVCDFGLAHVYAPAADGSIDASGLLREVCGSKSYCAPEVFTGAGYQGFGADVWSCAICLFGMIAGFFPLDEASGADWRFERVKMASAAGQSTCHTIYGFYERQCAHSAEAVHLIDMMLALDPSVRLSVEAVLASPWVKGTSLPEDAPEGIVYRGLAAPTDPNKIMSLLAEGSDELRGPVYRGNGGGAALGPPPMLCKQEAMFCDEFHLADP